MSFTKKVGGIAAAAMLTAQPCLAAQDFREHRTTEVRAGAFAGINFRVPLDRDQARRPTARLQLTGIREVRDATGASRTYRAEGVQIGAERDGRLALTVGGQDALRPPRERAGVGGSTGTTLLIVGGVVLVVFVLAAVASAAPPPGPSKGAFD